MVTKSNDQELGALAIRLADAYRSGTPIAPVRDELGSIDDAYRVQQLTVDGWLEAGRRVIGRKIGLTSPAVQRQLGVDQPDFGALMADMCLTSGEAVPAAAVLQPRVEAEVALVLSDDLTAADTTVVELIRAIDHLLPAIEVVGSRIAGWDISILDTIADNASSGLFVLGTRPVSPSAVDLADVTMSMTVNGEVVSTGRGTDCLGHPYLAALWLARRLAVAGTPLRRGDVLMTGALGPMVPLSPGAEVTASIDGLGVVRTRCEAAA